MIDHGEPTLVPRERARDASEPGRHGRGANPWLDRRVIGFAHQGGAHEAPPAPFLQSSGRSSTGPRRSSSTCTPLADRRLVVCHDPTLDRTTERDRRDCRTSLAELRRCSTTPTGSCPGPTPWRTGRRRTTRCGAGPPSTDASVRHACEVLEAFQRRRAESRHQAHRARGDRATRRLWLTRFASTAGPMTSSSPRSQTPRRLSSRIWAPEWPSRLAPRHDRVLQPGSGRQGPARGDIGRYVALQMPGTPRPALVVDERLHRRRPLDRPRGARLDGRRADRDGSPVNIGVDGIISDTPRRVLAAELGRLGANWKL